MQTEATQSSIDWPLACFFTKLQVTSTRSAVGYKLLHWDHISMECQTIKMMGKAQHAAFSTPAYEKMLSQDHCIDWGLAATFCHQQVQCWEMRSVILESESHLHSHWFWEEHWQLHFNTSTAISINADRPGSSFQTPSTWNRRKHRESSGCRLPTWGHFQCRFQFQNISNDRSVRPLKASNIFTIWLPLLLTLAFP